VEGRKIVKGGWGRERFFTDKMDLARRELKTLGKEGGNVKDINRRIERDRMGQWLKQRIRKSNYNDRYKNSTSMGMPDYLLKKGERGNQKIIAKWRRGNKEERNGF